MRLGAVLTVCLLLSAMAPAQVSKPGMGTVTGHVICQDTQKPARFAKVVVFAVPATLMPSTPPDLKDPKALDAWNKSRFQVMNSATMVMTVTGLDGNFVAVNVPPGDYYVMASVPGYVQPRDLFQAAYDAGEDLTKGIAGVPIVHVSADRSAQGEIAVDRGAAVEGHVTWDDGSPVTGAAVMLEPSKGQHKPMPVEFAQMSVGLVPNGVVAQTDDRGHYRLSGLAPGDYLVRSYLQTSENMVLHGLRMSSGPTFGTMVLTAYAPGTFHKAQAKPIKLESGEQHGDEDILFKLDGTHSVSGRVTSAEDHHGLGRGAVILRDASDKTFQRSAGVDADGNFTVTFVPSGTYTLSVAGAADTAPVDPKTPGDGTLIDEKVIRSYMSAQQQVIVADGDVTGEVIELKPVKATNADADAGNEVQQHVVVEMGH